MDKVYHQLLVYYIYLEKNENVIKKMSDIKRKVLLGYPPITQSYIGRFFKYIYSLLNKSKNKSIIIIN